jgi:hypothetical protein
VTHVGGELVVVAVFVGPEFALDSERKIVQVTFTQPIGQ